MRSFDLAKRTESLPPRTASFSAKKQKYVQRGNHCVSHRVSWPVFSHPYCFMVYFYLLLCAGCNLPQDPDRTFQNVRGRVMQVGILEQSPWATWTEGGPEGIDIRLLEDFASSCDARIEPTRGSESKLFRLLKQGQLDLVIGGITSSTPWSTEVGLTQPYLDAHDPYIGEQAKYVWAVAQGENRWLLEIDSYLQTRRKIASEWLEEAEL